MDEEKDFMVRVPAQLVQRIKRVFKELNREDNATVVRLGLHRLLMEKEAEKR